MKKRFVLLFLFGDLTAEATLSQHLAASGKRVTEGFVVPAQTEYLTKLLAENPSIKTIVEFGFNAGHSSELFLSSRSDTTVVSFDLETHDYVKSGKVYIDATYPGRHKLIIGNSLRSVPLYSRMRRRKKMISSLFKVVMTLTQPITT